MSDAELDALAQRIVDAMPEPSPEQCRRVALVLNSSGAVV